MQDTLLDLIIGENQDSINLLSIDYLVEIIDLIEENEFDNARGSNGKSIILELLPREQVELAKRLYNKTKSISIDEAVALGDIKQVEQLLEENPDLINQKSSFEGFSLLHLACGFSSSIELVKFLVEHGADPEVYSSGDQMNAITPIIAATLGGNLDIVEYLIKQGVHMDSAESNSGLTAFEIAKKNNRYDIVDLLGAHTKNSE